MCNFLQIRLRCGKSTRAAAQPSTGSEAAVRVTQEASGYGPVPGPFAGADIIRPFKLCINISPAGGTWGWRYFAPGRRRRKVRCVPDTQVWASVTALPCSSSPHRTRCAGLRRGPRFLCRQKVTKEPSKGRGISISLSPLKSPLLETTNQGGFGSLPPLSCFARHLPLTGGVGPLLDVPPGDCNNPKTSASEWARG